MKKTSLSWTVFCFSLILYGFLKDFKPGGPFLFKYQTHFLNLTREQLTGEINPCWTYSYLITLIPIFLLSDLLLYKPILILENVACFSFRILLVFGTGILSQQIGLTAYGIASATEVVFYSYIYIKVAKDDYQRLTSWTRAASMAGRTFSYLLSQAIISTNTGTYLTINEIALVSPIIAFIIGICLPPVHWKLLHERTQICNDQKQFNDPKTYPQFMWYRLRQILYDVKRIYRIKFIQKWSLWWAMTTCMSLQISNYSQSLWSEVQKEETTFNGFAEAIYTTSAAIAIMLMNMVSIDWDKWGEVTLVLISIIDCALLLIFSQAKTIYLMYFCYICYRALYQIITTIAQWNLAKKMISENYGLLFGLNSFVALVLQTFLTMIVVDKRGFGITPRSQFLVYGTCHAVIALIFLFSITYNLTNRLRRRFVTKFDSIPKMINHEQIVEKLGQSAVVNSISDPLPLQCISRH